MLTLGAAAVLFGIGQLAGYPLAIALATIAACAIVAALAVTRRPPRVTVVRELYPDRVERGRPAVVTLRVRNPSARRQPGFTAVDRVGSAAMTIAVAPLAANAEPVYQNVLPTQRRGRHQVGPLTLHRTDALGLGHRQLSLGETETLWVYPRTHPVRAVAGARPRHHHEGAITERSPRGSLDIREVREYVPGDEVRHLHWKATARTGRLMIRDYADPDQPRFTVLLDNRRELPEREFEELVELAASLVVAAANADHRCRLITSGGVDINTTAVRRLLDELCVLDRADEANLPLVPTVLSPSRGGSIVVVSATVSPTDCASLAVMRSRYTDVALIAIGSPTAVHAPGVKVLHAADAADAAGKWDMVIAS
jgi:uncharacterized protein (DUF58 family)